MLKFEELPENVQARLYQSEKESCTITIVNALESYEVKDCPKNGKVISHESLNDVFVETKFYVKNLADDVDVVSKYWADDDVCDIHIIDFVWERAFTHTQQDIIHCWLGNIVGDLSQVESSLEDIKYDTTQLYPYVDDYGFDRSGIRNILTKFKNNYLKFKAVLLEYFKRLYKWVSDENVLEILVSRTYDEDGYSLEPVAG